MSIQTSLNMLNNAVLNRQKPYDVQSAESDHYARLCILIKAYVVREIVKSPQLYNAGQWGLQTALILRLICVVEPKVHFCNDAYVIVFLCVCACFLFFLNTKAKTYDSSECHFIMY